VSTAPLGSSQFHDGLWHGNIFENLPRAKAQRIAQSDHPRLPRIAE
jgi:hypothetical protein